MLIQGPYKKLKRWEENIHKTYLTKDSTPEIQPPQKDGPTDEWRNGQRNIYDKASGAKENSTPEIQSRKKDELIGGWRNGQMDIYDKASGV